LLFAVLFVDYQEIKGYFLTYLRFKAMGSKFKGIDEIS